MYISPLRLFRKKSCGSSSADGRVRSPHIYIYIYIYILLASIHDDVTPCLLAVADQSQQRIGPNTEFNAILSSETGVLDLRVSFE